MVCDTSAAAATATCFARGTPVAVAGGSHRAIETLVAGDMVLALDPATGESGPAVSSRSEPTTAPSSRRDRVAVIPRHDPRHTGAPVLRRRQGMDRGRRARSGRSLVAARGIVKVASVTELAEIAERLQPRGRGLPYVLRWRRRRARPQRLHDDGPRTVDEPRLRVVPPDDTARPGLRPAAPRHRRRPEDRRQSRRARSASSRMRPARLAAPRRWRSDATSPRSTSARRRDVPRQARDRARHAVSEGFQDA